MKAERILLLDVNFVIPGATKSNFRSSISVYDFDIVIWDPSMTLSTYRAGPGRTYMARPSLDEADSVALVNDVRRRHKEFSDFLSELGRTLAVFVTPEQIAYVDTGRREHSGTGKNRQTTRIVDECDLLAALPRSFTATAAQGLEIEPVGPVAADLFRKTWNCWSYNAVLDSYVGDQIFCLTGTSKAVGSISRDQSGGVYLLLPEFFPDQPTEEDDETDEKESVPCGQSPDDIAIGDSNVSDYTEVTALAEWLYSLQSSAESSEMPDWVSQYEFDEEVGRSRQLASLERVLGDLLSKIEEVKSDQVIDAQWKHLVASKGAALERQVESAFRLFGFTMLDRQKGRSDLRVEHEGRLAVVEIKGGRKSAAERHAAQLEKWVAEELELGRQAKGILVVNAWNELPLVDRLEPAFPAQMIRYCEAREHCLVTGTQLLNMARKCKRSPETCKEVVDALLNTVGIVPGWQNLREIFAAIPNLQTVAESNSADVDVVEPDTAAS